MSKISIKTEKEIEIMQKGGRIAAACLIELEKAVKPGVSTKFLDDLAYKFITSNGAKPSFLNFHGYPASLCVSVNNEVVHGIPSDRTLAEGDIVGLDVGVFLDGFHTDTAITVAVGNISKKAQKIIEKTKKSLDYGIAQAKIGNHLGDISAAIEAVLSEDNYGIIRDLTGHGVGRELQEAPAIANYGKKGTGVVLEEGMVLAIEPMSTTGSHKIEFLADGWTIVTADDSLSAHFEHTVAITKNGPLILTK